MRGGLNQPFLFNYKGGNYMIKFAVEQWEKNKHLLEKDIRENIQKYNDADYFFLVEKVVEIILNTDSEFHFDKDNITVIDNGHYQGTMLYLIPRKTYQPSADEYLMTYVYYGSCSGCDTLQAIQWDWDVTTKQGLEGAVKDYMSLCLHLIQKTIRPYNHEAWDGSELFEITNSNN